MPAQRRHGGFSLIEMGIVLVLFGLLAGGLLNAMSGQQQSRLRQDTQRQLDEARESLLGFAIANGRLPCPAAPALGADDPASGRENCALEHGVLPWSTLSLPDTDPWNHRLSYFASSKFTAAVPAGALCSFTLGTGIAPDNAGTANIRASGSAASDLAGDLPAVIVSHGERPAGAWLRDGSRLSGASGDELENADADLLFIARTPSPDFDDLVVWLPAALLKARLLAAGRLP